MADQSYSGPDLAALAPEERAVVMAALGVTESGLAGLDANHKGIVPVDKPHWDSGLEEDGMTFDEDDHVLAVAQQTPDELAREVPINRREVRAVRIPDGVEATEFRALLGAAYHSYMETGHWDADSLHARTGWTVPRITKITTTTEFRAALRIRGVEILSSGLTTEQDIALQILTNPDGKTFTQKLRQAGVSMAKYRAWMQQPGFKRAMDVMTSQTLQDNTASLVMLETLTMNADLNAIKYKHLLNGTFDPNRQQMVDAQALISQVFQIIATEVADGETLKRIAGKMQQLGNEPPREIEGR